ncbi:MAG: hypothetical protein AAF908_03220, partial [Pseudomonadota bacterium]
LKSPPLRKTSTTALGASASLAFSSAEPPACLMDCAEGSLHAAGSSAKIASSWRPPAEGGAGSALNKRPEDQMCATSRMVVKRRGAERPVVLACTLLAYDPQFELGETLKEASRPVALNHPHCAKFCVLGGASCSG